MMMQIKLQHLYVGLVTGFSLAGVFLEANLPEVFGVSVAYIFLTFLLLPFLTQDLPHFIQRKDSLSIIAFLVLVSLLQATHSYDQVVRVHPLVQGIVLFIIVGSVLAYKERLIVFSLVVFGACFYVVLSPGIFHILDLSRGFERVGRDASDTLVGVATHYINYSIRGVFSTLLALALALSTKVRWLKMAFLVASALSLLATLTSGSRGGILAVAVALGALLLIHCRSLLAARPVYRFKYFIIVFCAVLVVFPWNRIIGLFEKSYKVYGSIGPRQELYQAGYDLFRQHWIMGLGWGGYRTITGKATHSFTMKSFIELGVFIGILELFICGYLFWLALQTLNRLKATGQFVVQQFYGSWICLMVSLFFWQIIENMGLFGGSSIYMITIGLIVAGSQLNPKTTMA